MSSNILVLNSGSSSLKFAIIEPAEETTLVSGLVDRIGQDSATIKIKFADKDSVTTPYPKADHHQALLKVLDQINADGGDLTLAGIGHRVVHGGEFFRQSVTITPTVLAQIKACNHLAPLHNPANVVGIDAISEELPDLPQVAVFDTAFHQSIPAHAFTYALPNELYKKHSLRRYGFHGTSHRYVTMEAAKRLDKPVAQVNLVTAHLGNGCSATAVHLGKSVDTSMGLTPLEGLVMGTRCGDVDPGLLLHLIDSQGYSPDELNKMLNKESGLLGISGLSNDMRTLLHAETEGDRQAALAISVFCYRLAKTIAGLAVSAHPLDALVFTGGIGENASLIRQRVCQQLALLGISIDPSVNKLHGKDHSGVISDSQSKLPVLVIPTNEELLIAKDTLALVSSVAQ